MFLARNWTDGAAVRRLSDQGASALKSHAKCLSFASAEDKPDNEAVAALERQLLIAWRAELEEDASRDSSVDDCYGLEVVQAYERLRALDSQVDNSDRCAADRKDLQPDVDMVGLVFES